MESVPVRYTISGIVTDDTGMALSGVTMALKLNGHTRSATRTASDGSYTFSNVMGSTSGYTILMYLRGYTFTPEMVPELSSNLTLTISAN